MAMMEANANLLPLPAGQLVRVLADQCLNAQFLDHVSPKLRVTRWIISSRSMPRFSRPRAISVHPRYG